MKAVRLRVPLAALFASALILCAGCSASEKAAESLTTVVTAEDIARLEEYKSLRELDLRGSGCYAEIRDYMAAHPEVAVSYDVSLGGAPVENGVTELTLAEGEYDFDALTENLVYLPAVTKLSLPATELSSRQLNSLAGTYPGVALDYTLTLGGREIPGGETALDLSDLAPTDIDEAAGALERLPRLASVELMDASGESALELTDVKTLMDAAPGADFHFEFDLFGRRVSTSTERVEYDGVHVGTEGLPRIRAALDIMKGCEYFKLADAGIDSETMAELRDDYPETKIVWRVRFGEHFSCLTDEETIRAIFKLYDDNCSELKYCTDVKYMDIGHNSTLHDLSFVAYMPKLEIVIVSGSPFADMTPFANCPELLFLELVWCGNVADLSPLENCRKLEYLNICFSQVDDLTPIYDLPLKRFCYYTPQLTQEQQREFIDDHPDCWTNFEGKNPYVLGWRYDDQGYTWCDMYIRVREVFRYDENFYNHS